MSGNAVKIVLKKVIKSQFVHGMEYGVSADGLYINCVMENGSMCGPRIVFSAPDDLDKARIFYNILEEANLDDNVNHVVPIYVKERQIDIYGEVQLSLRSLSEFHVLTIRTEKLGNYPMDLDDEALDEITLLMEEYFGEYLEAVA